MGIAFDRWWWVAAALLVPVAAYLNRDALGMQGVYPDYVCFRHVILSGFDPRQDFCESPTFPMWGYGFLLVGTERKLALLVGQGAAAIAAAWYLLRTLERLEILQGLGLRLVKLALVVSVPWYAFSALRWPYSEAISLVLVGLALLLRAVSSSRRPLLVFVGSGLLFGLALNFRSDYIALPLVAAVVAVALSRKRLETAASMLVWICAILVALVPWMAYSHRATGHFLLTSTNSGHVLYISLGQLPGNPWGITPFDGDPRMQRELDAHFGTKDTQSLTYASDVYLRHRFVQLVRQHPVAWLHKDVVNGVHTLTEGFYSGEFIQAADCVPHCYGKFGWNEAGTARVRSPLSTLFGSGLGLRDRLRFGLQEGSALEGRIVSLFGFLAAAAVFVLALRRRDMALALLALVPCFQWASNALAYDLSSYSSNAYVPVLATIAIAGTELARRWRGRAPRRSRAG